MKTIQLRAELIQELLTANKCINNLFLNAGRKLFTIEQLELSQKELCKTLQL